MLCVWSGGEGLGLDKKPSRGFAGQLFFFSPQQAEPMEVFGDISVYVFDDEGSEVEQARPLHQFDFKAEVWKNYLQETNGGSAYQLFIPYTRPGNFQAECTLRVQFTPRENGLPVYSKFATVLLGGKQRPESELAAKNKRLPEAVSIPLAKEHQFGESIKSGRNSLAPGTTLSLNAPQPRAGSVANNRPLSSIRLDELIDDIAPNATAEAGLESPKTYSLKSRNGLDR